MEVANQIINDGSVARGYLGVRVGEVDNDLAEALSMEKPYGALITDVEKGDIDSCMDVKMVFRVKIVDEIRGFTRYFWKAIPV